MSIRSLSRFVDCFVFEATDKFRSVFDLYRFIFCPQGENGLDGPPGPAGLPVGSQFSHNCVNYKMFVLYSYLHMCYRELLVWRDKLAPKELMAPGYDQSSSIRYIRI